MALNENLGHSDPRVTLDLNCHSSLETKRAAGENIRDLAVESRQKVQADDFKENPPASESVN
jgi:hypothetical protein